MAVQTASVEPEDVVEIEQVGGDLDVEGWAEPELRARGDAVQIQKRAGSVVVRCGGDLVLSVPEGAQLVVTAVGGSAKFRALKGSLALSLVGGDAVLRNVSGPVKFTGAVGGKIHLENVSDVSMSGGPVGPGFDIGERVKRKVEQAARLAEKKMRRADKVLQHAQIREHRFETGRWKSHAASDDTASGEPRQPASDEERLAILKMLQAKKITSEQASTLLAALEGGEES